MPLILDADGLNAFAGRATELKGSEGFIAVTPHPGEMARLTGLKTDEVQARRMQLALQSAAAWNAYVVLKGHNTIVAAPDGSAFINSTGNPGMGTGGTGDVLTGMLAALTAQFGTEQWERVLGVWSLSARSGRRHSLCRFQRSASAGERLDSRNSAGLPTVLCGVRPWLALN